MLMISTQIVNSIANVIKMLGISTVPRFTGTGSSNASSQLRLSASLFLKGKPLVRYKCQLIVKELSEWKLRIRQHQRVKYLVHTGL
jgi:hypothetical protein